MALVLTRSITVGGIPTTFYAYGSEPVENETTDDRGRNVVVRFEDVAGNPVTVRQVDVVGGTVVLTEVTTLTTSPVNGRLPTFYSEQGIIALVTDVDYQLRTSPGYLNLVGALATAQAAAITAGSSATQAAQAASDANSQLDAAIAQFDNRLSAVEAGGGGGGLAQPPVVNTEAEANAYPNGTLVVLVSTT